MDTVLYMLAICTGTLCHPFDPPAPCDKGFCLEPSAFTMTKAACEAIIARITRRDRAFGQTLSCFTEDEWIRRFPERPDKPIKPIAH